jgi:hypothetical protein
MGLFDKFKAVLRSSTPDPPDAPRLNGQSVNTLVASLKALPVGARGWITLREAWHLFSRVNDEQEAFGELDGDGAKRLEEFAADITHRSEVAHMPVEGRLYFTRK